MGDLYRIDTDVRIPRNGNRKYPWRHLGVSYEGRGPSFLVPCGNGWDCKDMWNSLTACARSVERSTGFKFVMRKVDGGIRVWRIH